MTTWQCVIEALRFARPHWTSLIGASVATIVIASVGLALPLGVRALLHVAAGGQSPHQIHWIALVLIVLFVARAVLACLASYWLQRTAERVAGDVRTAVFARMQHLDLLQLQARRAGDWVTAVMQDATYVRTVITDGLVANVLQLAQIIGAGVIMWQLDAAFAGVLILMLPLTAVMSILWGPRMRAASVAVHDKVTHTSSVVFESVSGGLVVRTSNAMPIEESKFRRVIAEIVAAQSRSLLTVNLYRATTTLMTSLTTIAMFWYGAWRVVGGSLTIGDLVAFLFSCQLITVSFSQFSQAYGTLTGLVASASRVREVLRTTPRVSDPPGARAPAFCAGDLRFEDVSFAYSPERHAVRQVSLTVNAGLTVALVGPSGCGKSTLAGLAVRLFDPDHGRVCCDGTDLRELPLSWLRSQIAVVHQDTFLFRMSVRDNIRFARPEASDREVEECARAAQAHEFIEHLPNGYDTQLSDRGVDLSGGQRQRIAIARAFLRDAPILIWDEATSHVDTASEQQIQRAHERLRRGRTNIIVAHRLSTIRSADVIVVMDAGRIVAVGGHDRLMRECDLYARLSWANREGSSEERSTAALAIH